MSEAMAGQVQISQEEFKALESAIKDLAGLKKAIESNLTLDISRLIEVLFAGAVLLNGSDLHIEPEETEIKLRIRIDGMLHEILKIDKAVYKRLLSRIKLSSGIKLNISDTSQDGRFSIIIGMEEIEVRVSTLPSEYGETIVTRILNPKTLLEIDQLGLREDIKEVFEKEIKRPNGMIIVTGPTGSGKTTTLYAVLKKIRNPEIKIITIEDPIEYHLKDISQSQVNPKKGYDFASGLSAIVRQDPDVILVGEIRNLETAQIALQAAMTGHLVLSTLHTNDAAGTVVRLQALGENLTNIAPALNLAIAQRLIRKVCEKCRKLVHPTPAELKQIQKELAPLPQKTKDKIKLPALTKALLIPKVRHCSACGNTGYKGRVGIYEFFRVDDEMENFILKSPSIADLNKKAIEKGMVTVKQDGFIKVAQGITTIEEVERITGE